MSTKRAQSGLTLIELIFFIVIVGGALAGVLSVLNVTTKSSADPLVRKTMLAIAQALMEEVQLIGSTIDTVSRDDCERAMDQLQGLLSNVPS